MTVRPSGNYDSLHVSKETPGSCQQASDKSVPQTKRINYSPLKSRSLGCNIIFRASNYRVSQLIDNPCFLKKKPTGYNL